MTSESDAPVQPEAGPSRPPKRTTKQLLADELLIEGAPSRQGGRTLDKDKDIWSHNAWDRVEWDEEQEAAARATIEKQRASPVPQELKDGIHSVAASHWDKFYAEKKTSFFNDRAWLQTEFDELAEAVKADAGPLRIIEIGSGPGNTLFPLRRANKNPHLRLHAFDYSKEAIALVRANPKFDPSTCDAQVWDLSSPELPEGVEPGTVDVATMIFVLSALHPKEWRQAVRNVYRLLKPGGTVLFRDYGRNDLTQLRFKKERFLEDNFYIRGDHTRVYFFERDELVQLFKNDGKEGLEVVSVGVDRRLLLNRKRQLKMYRIWLQGRWRKPLDAPSPLPISRPTVLGSRTLGSLLSRLRWLFRLLLSWWYRTT